MFLSRLAAAAALAIGLSMSSTAVFAEAVTIRYSNWLPPNFFLWDKALKPWIDEIERVTEGRVKVEVLPKVVGTTASQFDVVRDGLADMAFMVSSYTPGRFVLTEFGELPLLSSDASTIAPAFDRLYRKHLERYDEFKGVKILSICTISPSQLFTARKQIKTIHDIKGLKLRSPTSGTTAFLENLGGVAINKPSTEAFEMLATGTIDGQMTQANTVVGFGQTDLTRFALLLPGGASNAVNMVAINPDKWAEIAPADQEAIMAISAEKLAATVGAAYSKAEDAANARLKEAGYVVEEASPEMVAELREKLKPIEQAWIERAKAKGLANPEEILAEYRAAISAGKSD
ncbi:TRAP transporter substrate-binding protein [Pseudaminobacter sp. 19-2017]|uniref:TRAP transporter substrate-binding protein n=1 Tax=Pseudaminobacter soli (ex Zhang et al. 2022) TaxID=2831468 RepID=A0A942E6I5_9HYPH|nr:TRAP transporter substrate-binding protein [Pseudaminobacter soli]MBS3652043.1 TRAP transporter substrate-binding protein [Pseudaminobacter soli]